MLSNETLRFVDEATFQEAEPPATRSRPLEWRRSFNTITFTANPINVECGYSVNDIDRFTALGQSSAEDERPGPTVAPASKRRLRVTFQVAEEDLRDSIFRTTEKQKDTGLFQLRRIKGPINVALTDEAPTDQRGPYEQGAYAGIAFRDNFDGEEDSLGIEVSVPPQYLNEVVNALNAGDANSLHVVLGLQSFSYEVDDALREWHHPRDLFIHGTAAPAVLLSFRLFRREHKPPAPIETSSREADETYSKASALATEVTGAPLTEYASVLKSIRTALWVIAGLLLLALLK